MSDDAIRERHQPTPVWSEHPRPVQHRCAADGQLWGEKGCDAAQAIARVDELEAALPNPWTQQELLDIYDRTADRPSIRKTISALLARPEPKT